MDYEEIKAILQKMKTCLIENFELVDAYLKGCFDRKEVEHYKISKAFKMYEGKGNSEGLKFEQVNQKS